MEHKKWNNRSIVDPPHEQSQECILGLQATQEQAETKQKNKEIVCKRGQEIP